MARPGKTLRYEYGLLFCIQLQVEYVITGCQRQFNQNMSRISPFYFLFPVSENGKVAR